MQSKYPNVPPVKYRSPLGRDEVNYLSSKSKREIVHQRDESWLEGNTQSHGSMRAVLKLSHSDMRPDKKVNGFSRDESETVHIARVPINFGFGCITGMSIASDKDI